LRRCLLIPRTNDIHVKRPSQFIYQHGSVLAGQVGPTFRSADAGLKASATPKLGQLVHQRAAGDFFQDTDRGFFGKDQGKLGNDKSLFQGKLAGEHGMADHIRKHQPHGVGWKLLPRARGHVLEFLVRFEEVMKAQHPVVIRRPGEAM